LGEIKGFIHNEDLELISEDIRNKLKMNLHDNGSTESNLECVLLGHHTKGSVLLYHRKSKVLFCGDHICFFAEPLNNINFVDTGKLEREKFKKFVSDWSHNKEMRIQHNFSLFIEGLKAIKKLDAEYLCTGHGVVLKGNINEFILDLLEFE
jgi:glyoxylase-like metal-dependent hydrolase (beta-lactamase superfamily II)